MPIYEYQCDKCGYKEEVLCPCPQKSSKLIRECPKCKKGTLRKIISAFAYTPSKWKVDR